MVLQFKQGLEPGPLEELEVVHGGALALLGQLFFAARAAAVPTRERVVKVPARKQTYNRTGDE